METTPINGNDAQKWKRRPIASLGSAINGNDAPWRR